MKITLITPSPRNVIDGNRITALRWAGMFQEAGHEVNLSSQYEGQPCDILVALHAFKSSASIKRFREKNPRLPLVVVLSGTDLYRDFKIHSEVLESMTAATCLIVLQQKAVEEVPADLRSKVQVIYQSACPLSDPPARPRTPFQVCVVANLRPEKDPFRTADAVRKLPPSSRAIVVHAGAALSATMEEQARRETVSNPRYVWKGPLSHPTTRRLLAGSHLLVVTSEMEGSSNVLCEALADSVPVLSSRIPGMVGTLGPEYPGYFPFGDTEALTALLKQAETDTRFYERLGRHCRRASSLVRPEQECARWTALLEELKFENQHY